MKANWLTLSPLMANLDSDRDEEHGFDGNRSDILSKWLFPNNGFTGESEEVLAFLVEMTRSGDLQWGLFLRR